MKVKDSLLKVYTFQLIFSLKEEEIGHESANTKDKVLNHTENSQSQVDCYLYIYRL